MKKKKEILINKPTSRFRIDLSFLFFCFLLIFFFVTVCNKDRERKSLTQNGIVVKGIVVSKKVVGSKGTVRCFFEFKVNGIIYSNYDDTDSFIENQIIDIVYEKDDPDINRTKRFLDNY